MKVNQTRLYELSEVIGEMFYELQNSLNEDGEFVVSEQLQERLVLVKEAGMQEILNLAPVLIELEQDIDELKSEIKRLQTRKETKEKELAFLKEWAKSVMLELGVPGIENSFHKISVQKGGWKVDLTATPEEMKTWHSSLVKVEEVVTISARKKALIELHKAGLPLPQGAEVRQSETLRYAKPKKEKE